MLKIKQFCFISVFLVFALLGYQNPVHAEQANQSVKDCLEEPGGCGEDKAVKDQQLPQTNDEAYSKNVGLSFWDFIKMILATVFVVALLYFVLKFVNKKGSLYKRSQIIENLGGTSLGTNRSVQIIKIGNRLLVVGVGENIHLITEINDEKEYEQIITDYNSKMDQMAEPSDFISKMIKKVKDRTRVNAEGNPSFQLLLKKQLDEFSNGRKKLFEEIQNKKGSDKQ